MILEDVDPRGAHILCTHKHLLLAGTGIAENTGQTGVFGVAVADEALYLVSRQQSGKESH